MTTETQWWANLTGDDIEINAYGWPPYRVSPVADFIQPTIKQGPVLDVGCGPGRLGQALAVQNPTVEFIGIDVSPRMVKMANMVRPSNWEASICDGLTIPIVGPIGSAYSVTVFQHITHSLVQSYVDQIHNLLVSGGEFIFTYAIGEEDTFLSHQATHDLALSWLANAGFTEYERRDTPETLPAWNWAWGRK